MLLQRREELLMETQQNQRNLTPPTTDEGGTLQRNMVREVDRALTALDDTDFERTERALQSMAAGSHGLCCEIGFNIPFARLKIEPQAEHCVVFKDRWEKASGLV